MSIHQRSELEREDLPATAQQCETLIAYGESQQQRGYWIEDGKPVLIVPDIDEFGPEAQDSEVWIEATDDDLVQLEENR